MAPTQEMIEVFDQCLTQNIDLNTLSDFYILHTIQRTESRSGSARKLGITFNGLKKRVTKLGLWNRGNVVSNPKRSRLRKKIKNPWKGP